MSHFSLAVLHYDYQDVDSLLEPYDEGIVVAPYVFMTHEEVIKKSKREGCQVGRASSRRTFGFSEKDYVGEHRRKTIHRIRGILWLR